jgi:hypothetical protein
VVADEADSLGYAGVRQVEADEMCVRGRGAAEQEQRPAEVGADLEDAPRFRLLDDSYEPDDLRLELRGLDENAGVVEVAGEGEGLLGRAELGKAAPQLATRSDGRRVLADSANARSRDRADAAAASRRPRPFESPHEAVRRRTARRQRPTARGRPDGS